MTDSEKTINNTLKLQESLGELYTPEEVAEFFKVHLVTVYSWVKTNKIECHVLTQGKRKSKPRRSGPPLLQPLGLPPFLS